MKLRTTLALATLLVQATAVCTAEITVLSAGGIRPPLEELVAQFQRASGHKVAIKFLGGTVVKQQIDGGRGVRRGPLDRQCHRRTGEGRQGLGGDACRHRAGGWASY